MDSELRDVPLPPDWERRKAERVRKNEAAFRAHNERHKALEKDNVGQGELIPFVCECGDADCWDAVSLTITQFESAHAGKLRYAVKPVHVMPDYEQVVERHDMYWVVQKYAPGEAPAEAAARAAAGSASL